MKFVDVKNDVAFRKIFGNEGRKEVLISFLNAVLSLPENQKIVDVEILTPYQLPDIRGGKVTIVDVKARDQNNRNYIVEMQVADVDDFDKRVLYYASKSYSAQIDRGEDYENLNPIFFIGILEFEVTKNKNYHSRHKIVDIDTGENYIKDIEFNFIELPKFQKTEGQLDSIIDQWVYFIKNAENLDVEPSNINDEGLKFAYEKAAKYNWTKEELLAYDYVSMREQDYRGMTKAAVRKAVDKAVNEAVDKTIGETSKKIAQQLLKSNIAVEVVAQSTGLSIEEIKKFASLKSPLCQKN